MVMGLLLILGLLTLEVFGLSFTPATNGACVSCITNGGTVCDTLVHNVHTGYPFAKGSAPLCYMNLDNDNI